MVLITFLICLTSNIKADPVIIKKGQKVPVDGVFYSNDAHAKLVSKLQTQKKQCELEKSTAVEKAKIQSNATIATLKIDLAIEKQKLQLTRDTMASQKKLLLNILPKEKTSWWKSPTFVFWSGVVAGIIATGLATWGATEIIQKVK